MTNDHVEQAFQVAARNEIARFDAIIEEASGRIARAESAPRVFDETLKDYGVDVAYERARLQQALRERDYFRTRLDHTEHNEFGEV